jgi:excisionase family DNA binding protein
MKITLLKEEDDMVMDKELMNKADLAQYLGIKQPTLDKLIKKGLPTIRITGRLIRFRKNEVDKWLDGLKSEDQTTKKRYRKRVFKLKGKRGIYGWVPTIEKIKNLAMEKSIKVFNDIYPLYLFHEVLGVEEGIFIDLLERSAEENVIDLISRSKADKKKTLKGNQVSGESYYSFVYKGLDED